MSDPSTVRAYDLVWVEGRDSVSFLDGILSQDLEAQVPGSVARTFLLQPQGKLRHLLWALRGEERVGLLVDAGRGALLAEDLGYYRIRVKADIGVDDRPVFLVWGDPEQAAPAWEEPDGELRGSMVGRGVARRFTTRLRETSAPSVEETVRGRVLAGEPVMDVDVDESTIPQETGLVAEAVSFTKGCYLGQELVARIDTRGHVNRRLCGVRLRGGHSLADGTELTAGDKVVGSLTSPVSMGEETLALAMVRREVEVGDSVAVDGIESRGLISELPFSSD